jgi:alkylresorcinol/alkylpyrone synthase/polyketide synthase Type III
MFRNGGIARRYLQLPVTPDNNCVYDETQSDLLQKHRTVGVRLASEALTRALLQANSRAADIEYLCCVTSTGFLTPGFSALLISQLELRRDCARIDIVGMGCNAGLNALNAVANWTVTNTPKLAALLCIEVCSAAYVVDQSLRTAVVNSLFGDGAAALVVKSDSDERQNAPAVMKFSSYLIPDTLSAMRYDWDAVKNKFSFYLDRQIPEVIGQNVGIVIERLLAGTGFNKNDIAHWIVHAGGKRVINAVGRQLGLSAYDLRHSWNVLRDYGNVSSASFLFSYELLCREGVPRTGDRGVMMTMGPGSTIEAALLEW